MSLEQTLAAQCKIIVDDSFLLDGGGRSVLINQLLPALETQASAKLIVPERVLQTLDRRKDVDREAAAAIDLIHRFTKRKKLELKGEDQEVSGKGAGTRDLLVRVAYQFQQRYKLAFLTLDEDTARALQTTNHAGAIDHAQPLRVLCLNQERTGLDDWDYCCDRNENTGTATGTIPHSLDVVALASSTKIFIDTCSLMTPGASSFFQKKLIPALMHYNNKLLVARRTISELEKHASRTFADLSGPEMEAAKEKVTHAKNGLAIIREIQSAGLADIRQEKDEIAGSKIFVDTLILRVFAQHQQNTKLTLITQDRRLAEQILENARHMNAGVTFPRVGFINESARPNLLVGELGNWEWRLTWPVYTKNTGFSNGAQSTRNVGKPTRQTSEQEPFKLAKIVYSGSNAVILVQEIPAEGGVIIGDQSGRLTLLSKISEGGEGVIYKTSLSEVICKIYFKNRLTEDRKVKLELMVSRQSPDRMICWPLELVRNAWGEFVGYLMPLAKGETFNLSIFKPPILREMFPHWHREHLVQLAITTLSLIKKLHDLNVLIGDINPNNFMVCNEREVYLVDTDSFQIEAFPCPVGTPHFTPPELIGQSYGDFLRTKDHEVFAVATLLFMILFPGKPPYSGQGGGDVVESIQKREFPYVMEEGDRFSARPFGPYRFIWSHLHSLLKQDLKDIFHKGNRVPDSHPDERNPSRPTSNYVDRLLFDLRVYLKAIQHGRYSNELFPSDNWLRDDEDKIEIPCMEPSCNRVARFSKRFHQQLVQKGQTRFYCPIHFETTRLRNQLKQQASGISFRPTPARTTSQPQNQTSSSTQQARGIPSRPTPARTTSQPQNQASTSKSPAKWGSLVRWAMIVLFLIYFFFLRK